MALGEEALAVILRIDVNTTITTIHNSKALQRVSKPTESSCARRGTHQIASGNTHSLTRSLAHSVRLACVPNIVVLCMHGQDRNGFES